MSSPSTAVQTFFIPALDCPEEYALIDKGLNRLEGIRGTAPDYLGRALRVEFDPAAIDAAQIEGQLRDIGFPPKPQVTTASSTIEPLTTPIRWTTVVAGNLLFLAGVAYFFGAPPQLLAGMLIVSTVVSSGYVVRAAWRAIRLRAIDMNVLMTIAAIGAMATGEFFEAATAMFLFSISLWLESYTLGRARNAVRSLVQLTPTNAHRLCTHGAHDHSHHHHHDDGHHHSHDHSHVGHGCQHAEHHEITDIHPSEINVGDLLLVKAGERIPVDGEITAGDSYVNESPITGESMPIQKTVGDFLYAGSLNGEGSLEIKALKPAHESTLAHIARLVEGAQAARSPTERFVDRFARIYTPLVVVVALLIAFGPPLLAAAGFSWFAQVPAGEWLHRGLVLLVIACPCALVISTPVTIICGLHQATRFGLLVKGGEFLERAGMIRCVAFDKTGTLTRGQPRLIEVRPIAGADSDHVLKIAAALESASEHPLAAAIVDAAETKGWEAARATDVTTRRGAGVEGRVGGANCIVGSIPFVLKATNLEQLPVELTDPPAGATVALVAQEGRLLGALYLADEPRTDARTSITELRQQGIEKIVMLTGDSRGTAARIGASLGIDDVEAELLPQDKVHVVRKLVDQFGSVAMIGDGVNDAPALAASKLGIALGTQASDTALETADVVSLSPHVSRVPELFRLGKRTRDILTQNIAFSISIKLGVLLLALFGLGTLWAAVIADVGASMLVVFNGMRLLRPVEMKR